MPHALIRQARVTLASLEAQQRHGDEQIDLFAQVDAPAGLNLDELAASAAARGGAVLADAPGETLTPAEAQTLSLLASIDPDTLTPREALDALYKLKLVISS